ncbi:MAG: AAA family ATPase, partial [Planctomycetota bacterium]|nr:AAA family ATPase [Planctomycetota bacterium]
DVFRLWVWPFPLGLYIVKIRRFILDDAQIVEALAFFARLKRAPTDRAAGVLAEVSLQAHRRKRIRQLSGGMKQRLALAIALLTDPPLLVLDELTSNLDAAAQSGFMSLLRRLKSRGKTILFTSHHLGEIEFLAERVIVLDPGGKKRECTPESLAHTIGARCELKVFVAADAVSDAVEALRREGFAVTPNGRRVHVAVSPREKAGPIQALTRAGIAVMDFDLLEGAASRAFGEGDADG